MAQQVPPLEEVADHYRSAGILRTVDGRQGIDAVGRELTAALGNGAPGLMVTRKSRAEIERMRRRRRDRGRGPRSRRGRAQAGVSTATSTHRRAHIRAPARPVVQGLPGDQPRRPFPGSICISIDDEIVHGIPGERTIRDGQIVSIDAGAIVDGWHGDGARTFYVGDAAAGDRRPDRLTRGAMMAGIAAAVPGNHIDDISARSRTSRAEAATGSSASSSATASAPRCTRSHRSQLPVRRKGLRLEPGICLAIEPMFTLGTHEAKILPDDWTVVTKDGSLAAHFEHSIVVTDSGPLILTAA
jgi:methionyl aminopeptidase